MKWVSLEVYNTIALSPHLHPAPQTPVISFDTTCCQSSSSSSSSSAAAAAAAVVIVVVVVRRRI
jgi:uncharacterized protein (TIGR03382 family)